MMKTIKFPLVKVDNTTIGDSEGKPFAKVFVDADDNATAEFIVETVNQSTMLTLENEELKNKINLLAANNKECIQLIENSGVLINKIANEKSPIKKLSIFKYPIGILGGIPVFTLKYSDGKENFNYYPKDNQIDIEFVNKICEAIKDGYAVNLQ